MEGDAPSTLPTLDQLANVLDQSTMELLLSQLSAPSLIPLPNPASLAFPDDLASSKSVHPHISPPIYAPTPIRPTPSLLAPHPYASSFGSCTSLPLSSLSSSPSALSSGSSAFSLLQLPLSDSSFLLESRRGSAPEGARRDSNEALHKRRSSDFCSSGKEWTDVRRRHSMLPSSSGFAVRKSSTGRKPRTIYEGGQTKQLEDAFNSNRYMVGSEREALASKLGLTEAQVRVWFQNRRSKYRKQSRTLSESFDMPPSTTVLSPTVFSSMTSTVVPQLSIPPAVNSQPPSLGLQFDSGVPSYEDLTDFPSIQHLQMRDD